MATRPEPLRVFAPAKLNLFLHVLGKRADGYHALQSLVAFADIGDHLTFADADDFSLRIEGPFGAGLAGETDNLVLRAARALAALTGYTRGAHITLTKNLPVASGIGGGSADAAAALRGLIALWNTGDVDAAALNACAAAIGSDVPVCVASRTSWMEGRGERVTRAPALPDASLVLVNPGIAVSTRDVFRGVVCDPQPAPMPHAFADFARLRDYLAATRNDLEAPARALAGDIGVALDALTQNGCAFARMSGSGATCFGLFEHRRDAQEAADAIARPGWWVKAGGFVTGDF